MQTIVEKLKTATHNTAYGNYYIYRGIETKMNEPTTHRGYSPGY